MAVPMNCRTTLRALLDAAGRTPPDVAAAIGIGAARALARAHAAEAQAEKAHHRAPDAARICLSDRGEVFLDGASVAGGGELDAELHALGAVLHECLAGEPPGVPPQRLELPGVPPALAAVVDRATGAAPARYPSAAALAEAIAGAIAAPATPAEVAAYVDAIVPPEAGDRAERGALEGEPPVEVEVEPTPAGIVAPAAVEVEPTPAGIVAPAAVEVEAARPPLPARAAPSSPDSVRTFPRPAPSRRPSRLPAVVGAVALAAGFGIGFGAQRTLHPRAEPAVELTILPERAPDPASPAPQPPAAVTPPSPAPIPPAPTTAPAPPEPLHAPAKAEKRGAPATARAGARKGTLAVTAPDDADVLLDGRRVGRGNVKLEVAAGPHRIEVRRAGATVRERFRLAPGESWTYDVTPTPPEPTGTR